MADTQTTDSVRSFEETVTAYDPVLGLEVHVELGKMCIRDRLEAPRTQPEKIARLEQRFTALHAELQRDTPTLAAHAIANLLQA